MREQFENIKMEFDLKNTELEYLKFHFNEELTN